MSVEDHGRRTRITGPRLAICEACEIARAQIDAGSCRWRICSYAEAAVEPNAMSESSVRRAVDERLEAPRGRILKLTNNDGQEQQDP